ncbi:uncharacterized protein LOC102807342, partial [Saccoglossus kowalevskii]|uniref:Uncharacterized protein LOC102807342 n=1 Tax=Saccoglossus kowalevskii TaxID=10224 RepID=A0ABM0LZD0_SACKO
MTNLKDCVSELKDWMYCNKLKLNPQKTDILVFGMPQQIKKVNLISLKVDNTLFFVRNDVRNLGVMFDKHLNMRVQNAAARIVLKKRKYDRITPALISLHWLPVKDRIVYKLMLLVDKALNGQSPKYISEVFHPH